MNVGDILLATTSALTVLVYVSTHSPISAETHEAKTIPAPTIIGIQYELRKTLCPSRLVLCDPRNPEQRRNTPPAPSSLSAPCGKQKIQEILAPATEGRQSAIVDCSAKLPPNSSISKRLIFSGERSSNAILDCNGGTIVSPLGPRDKRPVIRIASNKGADGKWLRPNGVTIQSCFIRGWIVVHGIGISPGTLGASELIQSSHSTRHTANTRDSAPTNVTLDRVIIEGNGAQTLLYLGVGVTDLTLNNSVLMGKSRYPAIYLEAETTRIKISNNLITTTPTKNREQIAIDGSSDNLIIHNIFRNSFAGAINIYRNCGEHGMIRHTQPERNRIVNNIFYHSRTNIKFPAIWVSSRGDEYLRKHSKVCNADQGFPFGSSANNRSFAIHNLVRNNLFLNIPQGYTIRVDEQPNTVIGNSVLWWRK